jgi:hypothetical protein
MGLATTHRPVATTSNAKIRSIALSSYPTLQLDETGEPAQAAAAPLLLTVFSTVALGIRKKPPRIFWREKLALHHIPANRHPNLALPLLTFGPAP